MPSAAGAALSHAVASASSAANRDRAQVGADVEGNRIAPRRDRRDQRAGAPRCQHDAESRPDRRPHRGFDQALPHHPGAAGADRHPDGHLSSPRQAARQQQARGARRRRRRQQGTEGEQDPERLLELVADVREPGVAGLQCCRAAQIHRPAIPRHVGRRGLVEHGRPQPLQDAVGAGERQAVAQAAHQVQPGRRTSAQARRLLHRRERDGQLRREARRHAKETGRCHADDREGDAVDLDR